MKNLTKGFTLIELLIVIALLGSLAVGLLAALDPFEQIKKGADTGTRNIVSEVHGAILRYYGVKGNMPWCPTGTCAVQPNATPINAAPMGQVNPMNPPAAMGAPGGTAIGELIAAGELKRDFEILAGQNRAKVLVTGDNATATVAVCYFPTSKSFARDPNTKYSSAGVQSTTCVQGNAANASPPGCYWCVR